MELPALKLVARILTSDADHEDITVADKLADRAAEQLIGSLTSIGSAVKYIKVDRYFEITYECDGAVRTICTPSVCANHFVVDRDLERAVPRTMREVAAPERYRGVLRILAMKETQQSAA